MLGLVIAALAGCAQDSAADGCRLYKVTELPLHGRPGAWTIDVTMNEAPARLVFDTGSFSSLITPQAVERLKLATKGVMVADASGIGGSRSLSIVAARTFQIGALHGKHFLFFTADLGADTNPDLADGLLSIDFLKKYDIDLDLPDHKVGLYAARGQCQAPPVALPGDLFSLPMLNQAGDASPRINVMVNARRLTAVIDSGAPDIVIFRPAAARLGLVLDDLRGEPHSFTRGIGPRRVRQVQHVFAAITVGGLTLHNAPVSIVDQREDDGTDMLLGADFIQRVHLWISFSSNMLVMQYPPLPTPP